MDRNTGYPDDPLYLLEAHVRDPDGLRVSLVVELLEDSPHLLHRHQVVRRPRHVRLPVSSS